MLFKKNFFWYFESINTTTPRLNMIQYILPHVKKNYAQINDAFPRGKHVREAKQIRSYLADNEFSFISVNYKIKRNTWIIPWLLISGI